MGIVDGSIHWNGQNNFQDFIQFHADRLGVTREEYIAIYGYPHKTESVQLEEDKKPGPDPYHRGLEDDEVDDKEEQIKKQADMDDDDPDAYEEMPGDEEAREKGEVKTSDATKAYNKLYKEHKYIKNISDFNESVVNEWGSSDQSNFNKSIHKDMGSPKKMPSPFDDKLRAAAEDAVDFYWDDWEEYQTDRDGLIDDAVRGYLRRYFKEDFQMMQRMFASKNNESVNEGFTKKDWDVKWKMPKDNLFNATKTKDAVDNRYKALQNLLKDKPKELKAFDATDDHPAYDMSYDELMKWYNNLSESVNEADDKEQKSTDRGPLDDDKIETALKTKAEESGVPIGIIRAVMRRGLAAWKSGHRPGANQQQWGYARVNAFLTKGEGTWGNADKDLAKEVRDGGHDKKLKKA